MAFAIAEVQTIGQTFCVGSIPSTRFARPQAVAVYLNYATAQSIRGSSNKASLVLYPSRACTRVKTYRLSPIG